MSKSLQEQLLASGAAKPKQAKKARREKVKRDQAARRDGKNPEQARVLAQEIAAAEAAKRERDRQLNGERKQQREARERDAAAAQIIAHNRVAAESGSDAMSYSYTVDRKIRRIAVSDRQRRDLAAGRLGIVRHHSRAELIPRTAAQRLQETIPDRVWLVTADHGQALDPDDPYAEFPVPDDLIW